MPLVLLSGYPSAGKSQRAQQLKAAFEARLGGQVTEVHVVSDESLNIPKSSYYERDTEKAARGEQMSAVKRLLTKTSLVILDNLSYIKGFRYQLYCEAKALETNSCVVHVGSSADQCKLWNDERTDKWPQDLFDALVFRYEEPNSMNRWDSPLFILTPEDELPMEDIWEALILKKPIKPTPATSIKPAAPTDYLSVLNNTTASVVKQVLDMHRDMAGSSVTLNGMRVQLPLNLSAPQLNRIRRNFIQLNKTATIPVESIEPFFIEFLHKNWDL